MKTKISVCITAYNRARLLDHTLASLEAQVRQPDELIVSDDCSTDETPAVVEKWSTRFSSFRYNRNERNLNMPGNLNVAIGMANGEYIANLHDGDRFHPTLLEKWEAALERYPRAGFVFCGVGGRGPREDEVVLHDVPPNLSGREFYDRYLACRFSSIVWGTVMARRSVYDELLPFDPRFGFISDVDMWMRISLSHDVAYVNEPLIILDNAPTARNERAFSWRKVEMTREIQEVNIERYYHSDPERLAREKRRLKAAARRFYARRLVGRLWHGDLAGVREGITLLGAQLGRSANQKREPKEAE